jgi:hypothetical protein
MQSDKSAQKLRIRNFIIEHRVDLDVTTIDTDQLVANAFDRAGYRSLEDTKILAICSEIIIETYQEELRRLDELALKRGWLLKKNRL